VNDLATNRYMAVTYVSTVPLDRSSASQHPAHEEASRDMGRSSSGGKEAYHVPECAAKKTKIISGYTMF
jgi:hypothetical protein